MRIILGFAAIFFLAGCLSAGGSFGPVQSSRYYHVYESPEELLYVSFPAEKSSPLCRKEVLEGRKDIPYQDFLLLLVLRWPELDLVNKVSGQRTLVEEKDRRSGAGMISSTKLVLNSIQIASSFLKHTPSPQSTGYFCGTVEYRSGVRNELQNPKLVKALASERREGKYVSYCEAILGLTLIYNYGKAKACWEGSEKEKRIVLDRGGEVLRDLGL